MSERQEDSPEVKAEPSRDQDEVNRPPELADDTRGESAPADGEGTAAGGDDTADERQSSHPQHEPRPAGAEPELSEPAASQPSEEGAKGAAKPASTGAEVKTAVQSESGFWRWGLFIALILSVELFVYGHKGHIQVCVGTKGVTDFDSESPDLRKRPACGEQLNLGMWSSYEERSKEALKDACRRGTRGRPSQFSSCVRNDGNWTRRVEDTQVPPWDPRLYRRLFWLD